MQQISVEEAKTMLPALIDAALAGEEVTITQDAQTAVRLVPVRKAGVRPQFGSARGLIIVRNDFDEPLEDFVEYMS